MKRGNVPCRSLFNNPAFCLIDSLPLFFGKAVTHHCADVSIKQIRIPALHGNTLSFFLAYRKFGSIALKVSTKENRYCKKIYDY